MEGAGEWITRYYWGDVINEDEMGCTCDTRGGKEKYMQGFGGEVEGKKSV